MLIHSIIESRDAIFEENRFSSLSKQRNLQVCTNKDVDDNQQGSPLDVEKNLQLDEQQGVDPIPIRSKRQRKAKNYGPAFEVYSLMVLEAKFLLVFHIYSMWKVTH